MTKETSNPNHERIDDLGHLMKMVLGATVISMATSLSTHHFTTVHSSNGSVSTEKLSHAFDREREVLHAHANLGRVRYATVSGTSE